MRGSQAGRAGRGGGRPTFTLQPPGRPWCPTSLPEVPAHSPGKLVSREQAALREGRSKGSTTSEHPAAPAHAGEPRRRAVPAGTLRVQGLSGCGGGFAWPVLGVARSWPASWIASFLVSWHHVGPRLRQVGWTGPAFTRTVSRGLVCVQAAEPGQGHRPCGQASNGWGPRQEPRFGYYRMNPRSSGTLGV